MIWGWEFHFENYTVKASSLYMVCKCWKTQKASFVKKSPKFHVLDDFCYTHLFDCILNMGYFPIEIPKNRSLWHKWNANNFPQFDDKFWLCSFVQGVSFSEGSIVIKIFYQGVLISGQVRRPFDSFSTWDYDP